LSCDSVVMMIKLVRRIADNNFMINVKNYDPFVFTFGKDS